MMLNDLFAAALQLGKPWIVSKVEFTELQNNRDGRGKAKHDQTVAKAANEGDIEVNTILQGFMVVSRMPRPNCTSTLTSSEGQNSRIRTKTLRISRVTILVLTQVFFAAFMMLSR